MMPRKTLTRCHMHNVIPAEAGIQNTYEFHADACLDPDLRRGDGSA
jgi:hypothetical protein